MLVSNPVMNTQYTGTIAENATHRIVLHPAEFYSRWPSKITIQLGCEVGSTSVIDKVYFGRSALETGGNAYDFANAGTITEVTFGGTSGVTMAEADAFSDTVEFELHPTQTHVLSIHTTSAASNTVQYSSTSYAGKFNSYTREGGDWAADVLLGGLTTTYADKAFFIEALYENDGLTLASNLPSLETSYRGGTGLLLPTLELSATTATRIFMWTSAKLPVLEIEAESGNRCTLEERLPTFGFDVQMGARCDTDLKLPFPDVTGTVLPGSVAILNETIPTFALSAQMGAILNSTLPIPTLDITVSGETLMSLEKDLPGLTIIADGGRVGIMDLAATLSALELTGEIRGFQSTLAATLSALKIQATLLSGYGSTLETWLPALECDSTTTETALITLDKSLPPLVMGAISTGADDGTAGDGGSGGETTRFATTVLRHERYP